MLYLIKTRRKNCTHKGGKTHEERNDDVDVLFSLTKKRADFLRVQGIHKQR
jgi:hypothetical protein